MYADRIILLYMHTKTGGKYVIYINQIKMHVLIDKYINIYILKYSEILILHCI